MTARSMRVRSTTTAMPTKEMSVPIAGLRPRAQDMSTMRMLTSKRMVPTVSPLTRDSAVNSASGGATPKPPSIIMPSPTPTRTTPMKRAAHARGVRSGLRARGSAVVTVRA